MNNKKSFLIISGLCIFTTASPLHGMLRNFYSSDSLKLSEQSPDSPIGIATYTPLQHALEALDKMPAPTSIDPEVWQKMSIYGNADGYVLSIDNTALTTDQFRKIIDILPEVVQNAIVILCVSYNQLTEFPAEVARFKNLRSILAHNNQLTRLPAEITDLKYLTYLSIDPTVTLPIGLRSAVAVFRVTVWIAPH